MAVRNGCHPENYAASSPFRGPLAASRQSIQVGDLDASGINQVVFLPVAAAEPTVPIAISVSPTGSGTRDGLLQTISNGVGASTTIEYGTVYNLLIQPQSLTNVGMPVPAWVVTETFTDNGLAAGVGALAVEKHYDDAGPIYDPRDRAFVGFRSVTESVVPLAPVPGRITTTTFATIAGSPGAVDNSVVHVSRGLPLLAEASSYDVAPTVGNPPSGKKFTTLRDEYHRDHPYPSLDGRQASIRTLAQESTFLWDDTQAAAGQTVLAFDTGVGLSLQASLPSTELRTKHFADLFGNETLAVDYGLVGTDTPIHEKRAWVDPAGDPSGWMFRIGQTQVGYGDATGEFFSGPIREYDYQYTAQGLLQDVSAVLSGSMALPRAPGGAPQPPDAPSTTGATVHLRHMTYDGFGNILTASSELNQRSATDLTRCAVVASDPVYAQFPTSVTSYPGGCNAGSSLVTTATFDRGLEVLTTLIAPSGQITVRKYDDFGRLAEVDEPNPSALAATVATFFSHYDDTGPVRRVTFQTSEGTDAQPSFVEHQRYVDGFSNTIESVDQAAPASTGPQWIVSDMFTRDLNGLINQMGSPFYLAQSRFPNGHPDKVPFGTLAVTTFGASLASFSYDGLGRLLTSSDFNGNTSTRTYHTAQVSVDVRDPAQGAGGDHPGALTTITRNGHGQVRETDQILSASSHGAGDLVTTMALQATGEPLSITQAFTGSFNQQTVTRTMQYDSLGRMVLNQEPNAGSWTYAYNDSGELVGTSDARGCGENIFHDGVGRVIAEDYSPCSASQPGYTPPNLSTGAGTEAFYVYDGTPGLLAAAWDRAQHAVYSYDQRSRVTGIQRQVAGPGVAAAGSSATSASGLSISGAVVDAQGNPMANQTLTLSGTGSGTATTSTDGTYSFPGLKSGGSYSVNPPNIPGCTFDPSTVANLNAMTTSQVVSFMGVGSGACNGSPVSTPIAPRGSGSIAGVVTEN